MTDNPSTERVTARIVFEGVMLACINVNEQYEVGMVKCPHHAPEITVNRIENRSSTSYPVPWPSGDDLLFKVNNPDVPGVCKHPTTDPEYGFFRVLDLEGLFMHREGVTVDTDLLQGRRLAVTAGSLYTHKLTNIDFNLLTWTDLHDRGTRVGHLGQIAKLVGLNIRCGDEAGSGIEIINLRTGQAIYQMPVANGVTYVVEIKNDCSKDRRDPRQVGTDFRLFYQDGLITSEDDLKFDLEEIGLRSPGACETGFAGQTDSLGIET